MTVEPFFVIAGILILAASLILTAAFFVLNDRLETDNRRMQKLLDEKNR